MVVLSKVAHSKSRGFQSFLFQKFFQIQASKTKKKPRENQRLSTSPTFSLYRTCRFACFFPAVASLGDDVW